MSDSDEHREAEAVQRRPFHYDKPIRRFFFDEQANVCENAEESCARWITA
jgi:hypothetical protein